MNKLHYFPLFGVMSHPSIFGVTFPRSFYVTGRSRRFRWRSLRIEWGCLISVHGYGPTRYMWVWERP